MSEMLLLDAGNTSVKWQWISRPKAMDFKAYMKEVERAPIHTLPNEEAGAQLLCDKWLSTATFLSPGTGTKGASHGFSIRWVSVGPESVAQEIQKAYQTLNGVSPSLREGSAAELFMPFAPIKRLINDYRNPSQLGADRWMAAAGLATRDDLLPGMQLLVCAGSATTVNLLSFVGSELMRFSGGLILPGVRLMHESLKQHTRDLGYGLAPIAMGEQIAQDSQSAITQGIALSQAGFVAPLLRKHQIRTIFVTGGDAQFWSSAFVLAGGDPAMLRHDPSLVFKGLAASADAS